MQLIYRWIANHIHYIKENAIDAIDVTAIKIP